MIDIQNDHLGSAAGLASGLDHAREGVESLHEAERAAGRATAGERLSRSTQRRKVRARAAAPLEEHTLGLGESQNRVERILDRVDEASGALRLAVSGNAEFDLLRLLVPVPVLAVGLGLDAVASHIEP